MLRRNKEMIVLLLWQNVVASQISSQLIRSRELACSSVYECALNQAVLPSDCAENEGRSAGETKDSAFFGHVPMEYKVGGTFTL
jgi:hypothetical protein